MHTFSCRFLNAVLLLALSLLLWPTPSVQAQCTFTNNTFETGTLAGWTTYQRSQPNPGTTGWFNYTGASSPSSFHIISAPPQGTRAAISDQNGATTAELTQDFTVPAGQSGTLSFYIYYNNLHSTFIALNSLDYNLNQQARVDLIKITTANESVAASDTYVKLFQTKPGDPLSTTPTLMTYDISGLAGLTARLRFATAVGINYFMVGVDNVCFSTTRGTITRPTAVGSNVKPDFGGVNLRFPTVTTAGTTSLTQLDPATVQVGAPANDTFIGPAYDLSTTAVVTTPISVCMFLPGITDNNTFSHLRMLHKEGGIWVDLPTSKVDLSSRQLCGTVATLSPFTAAVSSLAPTAAPVEISGTIVSPDGAPLAGSTVNLSGSQSRKTITDANGEYGFDDVNAGSFYTVTPSRVNYLFNPGNRSFSVVGNVSDAAFTSTVDPSGGAVIDSPDFFVRQHYLDFLGREPDEAGFNFWSGQMISCGNDFDCSRRRRINVSAAYFLSTEFQQTGGLVDALYRLSFARPPAYSEFVPDSALIGRGVVLGRSGWERQLAANKSAFIAQFIERAAFRQAYDSLSKEAYVDALMAHTGLSFTSADRAALVTGLSNGTLARGDVLQRLAENERFVGARRNEALVMMQYFGYLRCDPDESGYRFWLSKLNQFNGNFEQAEMVKAFIDSGEYRARFAR